MCCFGCGYCALNIREMPDPEHQEDNYDLPPPITRLMTNQVVDLSNPNRDDLNMLNNSFQGGLGVVYGETSIN